MFYRLNLIGAGRVGQSLVNMWAMAHKIQLQAVYSSTLASSIQAIKNLSLNQGFAVSNLESIPEADIYLITTPDDSIGLIVQDLLKHNVCRAGSIIMHCSAALGSGIFLPLQNKGVFGVSAHPARSFAMPLKDSSLFSGTYCALEGDEPAVSLVSNLFTSIGGHCLKIAPEHKNFYHIAGVMTTNYLVTLAYHSQKLLIKIGISELDAAHLVYNYMHSAVHNIKSASSIQNALTGPVQRGDINTVQRHCSALESHDLQQVYQILAQATLPLAGLNPDQNNAFLSIFKNQVLDHSN